MARSFKLNIFGVDEIDALTDQQYQVLTQVEKDRLEYEAKVQAKVMKEAKAQRGRRRSRGGRRVNEDSVKGDSVSFITKK